MTIFDLLFIVIVVASLAMLAVVIATALRGRGRQAVRLLAALGVCLALYLGVIALVALASPPRVMALGQDRCFDDWCVAVEDIARVELLKGTELTVTLRVSNRARRAPQRENGVVVAVLDEEGQRFEAAAPREEAPFSVLLQPGEAVTVTRRFEPASQAHHRASALTMPTTGAVSAWEFQMLHTSNHKEHMRVWVNTKKRQLRCKWAAPLRSL